MDSNEFIRKNAAVDNLIPTNSSEVKENTIKPTGEFTSDSIMFWGIFGFIICWVAIFFMLSKRGRMARKEIAVNVQISHQIPCKNCQFYSNDPHLKCAVNPSVVLTERAINCTDYCDKENKLS